MECFNRPTSRHRPKSSQPNFSLSLRVLFLAWILTESVMCLSAGFGEECEDPGSCMAGLVCSTTFSTCQCEPGFNYIHEKCIETPYGGPCSEDADCPRGSKCVDKNGNLQDPLLCIAAPAQVHDVHVEQYLDQSWNILFNITWKMRQVTGPTWFIVDVRGKDFTMPTYQYGSVTITEIGETSLITTNYQYGGWMYRILINAVTGVGQGPVYRAKDFFAIDSKPGLVQKVAVEQDSSFANEMKLTFDCPISTERNGNITAFIIRKTITTDDSNMSTEYTIPHHFVEDACEITVNASQVGGIEVLNNYTFEVKIKNSKFEGDFTTPVKLFTHERKPYASTLDWLENLLSPYEKTVDDELPSTFDVKLCSSCFVNPVQGPIKSAAIILCVMTEKQACMSSFFHPGEESMEKPANRPEDIDLYNTWASARAKNFSIPYRTTPEGWVESLRKDNSKSFTYAVGSNKNCDEMDSTTFCNGPLPHDKNVAVSVVVCNDAGCDVTVSYDEEFNTKAKLDDNDENEDVVIIGLAIGLGLVSVICLCLVAYVCYSRSNRQSMQVSI